MAERMTEREQFYYGKGYSDGRIAFLKEILTGQAVEIDVE